jgi:hypothetical protein
MEEKTGVFEKLFSDAEDFARTTLELVKLRTVEKISDSLSSMVSRTTALIFFFMFFLTGSIGLCLWLSEILGKIWAGFLLVAGIYGFIAVLLWFFIHKWFKRRISDVVIKQLLK